MVPCGTLTERLSAVVVPELVIPRRPTAKCWTIVGSEGLGDATSDGGGTDKAGGTADVGGAADAEDEDEASCSVKPGVIDVGRILLSPLDSSKRVCRPTQGERALVLSSPVWSSFVLPPGAPPAKGSGARS